MEAQTKAALPVIESMARAGLRVAAGSEKRISCGFYSRGCRERHVYPSARHHPHEFKAWLLKFLASRSISVLFPVGHYGAAAINDIQDEVKQHTRMVFPSKDAFRKGYEKIPTMKAALAAGVPIPDSWFPADDSGGVNAILPQIKRWPVLVKPSVGVGARGITWCHDVFELRRQYDTITAAHGESYIQDFVPPGGMQFKVDMLIDDAKRILAGVVYGKTRMYPPAGGSSVLNFSADRPDILALSEKMLHELNWYGFGDFDFVEDPRDGVVKLMEINPRFPESFNMGCSIGLDFPLMMYRMAHGLPVEPVRDYPKGRFLRFLPGELLWFLRVSNRERFNTWPNWFKFFSPDTSYQLCRRHDLGPIMGYFLENFAACFNPALLKERLRFKSGPRS